MLARESFNTANIKLIELLSKFSNIYDFHLKLHPTCDVALFHKLAERNNMWLVDPNKTILYTEFKKTISEIAVNTVDNNEFSMEIIDTDFHDVEFEYTIKNKGFSAEHYNNLLKNEITKIYNKIKDKELINDTLFGEDSGLNNVDVYFCLYYDEGFSNYLGGITLKYSLDKKWETGYNNAINDVAVTQEKLNEVVSKGSN